MRSVGSAPSTAGSAPGALGFRLAFFYAATVSVIGVQLPFWPVWLEQRGLGPEAIGWVLAAGFWPRVATTLLIAAGADRLGERKWLMVALSAITLGAVALLALAETFWPLLLLAALIGIGFSAVLPLGEALALKEGRERGVVYGRVRLWGSIAFIVVAVGAGRWLEQDGAWIVLPVLLLTVGAMLVSCLALPATRVPPAREALRLGALIRRAGFLRFVVAAALIHASHAVYYGFASLHWRAAGYGETVIGWLWAEGVLAEIVLFALAGPLLARIGPLPLLAIAGALTIVRWIGTALGTDLALLVLLQALHAASFGAAHLAAMHHLRDDVPAELQASAQGWLTSTSALLFGVLSPVAGWLFGLAGGLAFGAMAVVAVLGTAIAATLLPRHRRDADAMAP